MKKKPPKIPPGRVRDAIIEALSLSEAPMPVSQIEEEVSKRLGPTPTSSVRSYLRLNTPSAFVREARGVYSLRNETLPGLQRSLPETDIEEDSFTIGKAQMIRADCLDWIEKQPDNSLHAVVTDPPYGLHEYSAEQQDKLRRGKGGVWRIPPSFDGHQRAPLPRFTVLTDAQLKDLGTFFLIWGRTLLPKLVPGAHVVVASNPLLSYVVAGALSDAGFERRGEIIRLVMTMRGGDRPKAAHDEFSDISVMPRSMWEPWIVFRKHIEGRVQDNLRRWKTGGFRRPVKDKPFGDVIASAPTRSNERSLAPHPSLKPQAFLRQLVHGVLPVGEGTILDPFAGSGSTLAAAEAVGYASIGIEKDPAYFEMARTAIPKLARFQPGRSN